MIILLIDYYVSYFHDWFIIRLVYTFFFFLNAHLNSLVPKVVQTVQGPTLGNAPIQRTAKKKFKFYTWLSFLIVWLLGTFKTEHMCNDP